MPTIEVIDIQERRDTVPLMRQVTGWGRISTEEALGLTQHLAIVRGPSGKPYALQVPRELAEELRQQVPVSPPVNNEAINALFRWRDSATDRYGNELISLLMAEFSTDPEVSHHNRREVPQEHQAGLQAFRALPLADQEKLVEAYVDGTGQPRGI